MWTKKIFSLMLIILTLLSLITACASTGPGDKDPFRYEPTPLTPDHKPPPTSGGP